MRDTDDAGFVDGRERLIDDRRRADRIRVRQKLSNALSSIAKGRRFENPAAEAQKIKSRLLRRIEDQIAKHVRDRRYDARILPWRSEFEKPNERWARHLVRLETNLQSIGRLRGAQRMDRKQAIENAAGVKPDQLTPVE